MRVLLFTGGLDSTALAWLVRPEKLVFFDYGQMSAKGEERAARAVANALGIAVDVLRIDMCAFGHGTMSASGKPLVAESKTPEFWPYRNQMLITFAAMTYAAEPVKEILIGTVLGDDAHPDGRNEFISAIDGLVRQQSGVRVFAPAIDMTTLQLVRKAAVPQSVLGWTFSCHTGEWACGACRGCNKHRHVIECLEASIEDRMEPTSRASSPVLGLYGAQWAAKRRPDEMVEEMSDIHITPDRSPEASSSGGMPDDTMLPAEKGLDHAWRYFALHAQQRISVFNFFVVLSGILATGIGAGFQAGKAMAPVVFILGALLVLFSLVFYRLDGRGSELVKLAEAGLIEGENKIMPAFARIVVEEDRRRASNTSRKKTWTFSESFRLIFWVMGIIGVVASVFSFVRWATT